jgi:predicted ATPase with chaperone activity
MLAIQGQLPAEGLSGWASTGSLDLAGNLHLPHEAGLSHIPTPAFPAKAPTPQVVKVFAAPTDWLAKARAMPQLDCSVHGAKNLSQLMDQWRAWRSASSPQQKPKSLGAKSSPHIEEGHWRNLEGEGKAKKWLSIAAKKRLPVLMSGGPGMGKSSLARACRGLLPTLPPPHS